MQRSVAGAAIESGEWDGDEAAPDPVRPTPFPTSAPAILARELPVVAAETSTQRLTSLAPGADPAPIATTAQRSRAVSTPTAATTPAPANEPFEAAPIPAQRLTLGQARRLGLGAPIKQVPDHNVQRAATDPLPLAQSPVPTLPKRGSDAMEASSGEVPADITTVQIVPNDAAVVQRVPADIAVPARASLDLARSTKAPMDLATGVRQTRTSSPRTLEAPSPDATEPPRFELPLARTSAREAPSAEDRQPTTPTVQLSATSSPAHDFLSGLRPIVQRRADGATPAPPPIASAHAPAMPLAPASVPGVSISSVQRVTDSSARVPVASETSASDAALAPLIGSRPLRPTAMLQRSTSLDSPHHDPLPQGVRQFPFEGPPPAARKLAFDASSEEGSELPLMRTSQETPHSAVPRKLGREFENPQGARDVSSGRLTLAPSLAIAVQRASENMRLPDPPLQEDTETLQAVWYQNRAAVSPQSEGVTTSESASPAAATGPSQASETDMDELAGKLYDRIRSRLKTELLVDRERAGFLTDLR